MIRLRKGDSITMAVRDNNQAAAFLNNGWTIISENETVKEVPKETPKVDFSEVMNPPEETKTDTKLTKTDINRMSLVDLKDLAAKEGLSDVDSKSGADLKKELIEHFNL